jgi:hypothetical protein
MLAGAPPFTGDNAAAILLAHLRDAPPALVDVPEALARVVRRCLEKDPAQRFANAADARLALLASLPSPASSTSATSSTPSLAPGALTEDAAIVVSSSSSSPATVTATSATPAGIAPIASTLARSTRSTRSTRSNRRLVALTVAVVVVLAVIAASVVVLATRDREPPHLASIPILSSDPALQAQWRAAVLAFYDGDGDKAAASAASIVAKQPDAAAAWFLVAIRPAVVDDSDPIVVLAHAQDALAKSGDAKSSTAAIVALVEMVQKNRGVDPNLRARVDESVEKFAQRWPRDYFAQLVVASLFSGLMSVDERENAFARLSALDPAPVFPAIARIDLARDDDKLDDVERLLDAAEAAYPNHPLIREETAMYFIARRRYADARDELTKLLAMRPDLVRARALLADVALDLEDEAARTEQVRIMLSEATAPAELAPALVEHAVALAVRGRIKDAEPLFARVVDSAGKARRPDAASSALAEWTTDAMLDGDAAAIARAQSRLRTFLADASVPALMRTQLEELDRYADVLAALFAHDDSIHAKAAALEALDDKHFAEPRDRVLAFPRALVLANDGKIDDALAVIAKGGTGDDAVWDYFDHFAPMFASSIAQRFDVASAKAGALAGEADQCVGDVDVSDAKCRIMIAWSLVIGAECAHHDHDDNRARLLLERFGAWWPHADDDAPAVLRAKALRAAL